MILRFKIVSVFDAMILIPNGMRDVIFCFDFARSFDPIRETRRFARQVGQHH